MIIKDIILSITLVAAVVVPTWFLVRASNKTRRFLTKELIRLNQVLPENYDIWNRRALALHQNKTLIFINLHKQTEEVMELEDIKTCSLVVNGQKYTGGTLDMKTTNSIDLVLQKNGKSIKWNMYDTNLDDPVEGGQNVVVAKKYEELIKKSLVH